MNRRVINALIPIAQFAIIALQIALLLWFLEFNNEPWYIRILFVFVEFELYRIHKMLGTFGPTNQRSNTNVSQH